MKNGVEIATHLRHLPNPPEPSSARPGAPDARQVIDFLNKQLTDRELAFGLGAAPSGLSTTAPADRSPRGRRLQGGYEFYICCTHITAGALPGRYAHSAKLCLIHAAKLCI